eukprot:6490459-Amphidinium_carterae.2
MVVRPWRVVGCVKMRSVSLSSNTTKARICLGLSPIFSPLVFCMALPTFSPSAPAKSWAVNGKVGESAKVEGGGVEGVGSAISQSCC